MEGIEATLTSAAVQLLVAALIRRVGCVEIGNPELHQEIVALAVRVRVTSSLHIWHQHGQTGTDRAREHKDPAAHVTTLNSP